MPTKMNGLTEVSAKGYLLIHKFLVQVKLKYCERNKIIVCKLDSLFCVLCFSVLCSLSLQELSISLPWKVFFLRHLPPPNTLRDFKTLYFETSTHLQISENILWGRYGYFLEQHNIIIIFLTGGFSDINGTVPHSLRFYHKKLVCSRMFSQNENPV